MKFKCSTSRDNGTYIAWTLLFIFPPINSFHGCSYGKKKKAVLTLEETKSGGGDSQITNSDYMIQEEPPGAGKEL